MLNVVAKKEVSQLTGYSGEHIRRLVHAGAFPKPINLNAAVGDQWSRKAWLKSEVEQWLAERIAARDQGRGVRRGR